MQRVKRQQKRGNYTVLMAFMLAIILSFGALAIDVSYMQMANGQCQDIADAASQAALMEYRRDGDESAATAVADAVIAQNRVAGLAPSRKAIRFGEWNPNTSTFTTGATFPNAVQVEVGRTSAAERIGLVLAPVLGWNTFTVEKPATSASRTLEIGLVMDITGSWSQANFNNARAAALTVLDYIEDVNGKFDKVGMVIYSSRAGYEYTPWTLLRDEVTTHTSRTAWAKLNVASKGAKPKPPATCTSSIKTGWCQVDNDFSFGGFWPDMPREYADEPGTDHSVGLQMAEKMFADIPDTGAYRALIVMTDGISNPPGNWATRRTRGTNYYGDSCTTCPSTTTGTVCTMPVGVCDPRSGTTGERRWRYNFGPQPHNIGSLGSGPGGVSNYPITSNTISYDSVKAAERLYNDHNVNIWFVSFIQSEGWFPHVAQGDGYFVKVNTSADLIPVYENIARSLPLAIVK